MLENVEKVIQKAKKGKYAIPQFNINDSTSAKFILEVCEEKKAPVILGCSEGALKYMGGPTVAVNLVKGLIKDLNITIPVILHLDHGQSIASCKKAIDAGFTSVMYDGSTLPIEQNVKNTIEVVEYARKHNATVEAEVGTVGGTEDGITGGVRYASLDECIKMSKTGISMLAASLGSVHGFYHGEPKLGFTEMETYAKETNLPLVLHGGSGIPDDQIKRAIMSGEAKININTEIQNAFNQGIAKYYKEKLNLNETGYMLKNITGKYAIPFAKAIVAEKIELFGNYNKA
ncbi:MAG: fructose-1,6-bisphosphate aldolase, class II [Candidatus Hepatoplasma vulgare]|nr:MAG: fructose-1,6-bisphosphate aldolase, class II [Candidatus Hepatoplasma sp.]